MEKSTEDCMLISLQIPPALESDFKFTPGQHLTIKHQHQGEEIRRNYSLCSSPNDSVFQFAVKQIPDGIFSTYANHQLSVGDTLEVMAPTGRFGIHKSENQPNHYVVFAAGSGITPILSMISHTLETDLSASFQLFYTNRNAASIILKEALDDLKNIYMDRMELFHILTQEERDLPLFNGRLNPDKLTTIFQHIVSPTNTHSYYLCGPKSMIDMLREFLQNLDIPKDRIHFELFYAEAVTASSSEQITEVAGNNCEVTIYEGGKSFSFAYLPNGHSLLDSALAKSANLPFACKGGVCCTCRAKLIEGNVEMKVNYALEQEEVKQGYILACQAVPTTNKIVIDFDQ